MSPEKDNELIKKYPKLFKYATYIGTNDGWYNLIDQLCFQIQSKIDHSRSDAAKAMMFNRRLRRAIQTNSIEPITRGETWNWLIADATEALANKSFKTVPEPIPQVVISQVKEKFGTLRFYYTGGDDQIFGMVALAEGLSSVICESCAAQATTQSVGGYVTTRCPKCIQELYNRRA